MEASSIFEILISIVAISAFYYLLGRFIYKAWERTEKPPKPHSRETDRPWRGKQDLRGLSRIEKQRWN